MALRFRPPVETEEIGHRPGSVPLVVLALCVLLLGGGFAVRHSPRHPSPTTTIAAAVTTPTAKPAQILTLPDGRQTSLTQGAPEDYETLPFVPELDRACWWNQRPTAEHGATIVVGQARRGDVNGPFAGLYRITEGQRLFLSARPDISRSYQVTDVRDLPRRQMRTLLTEQVSRRGAHRLVLVTSDDTSTAAPSSGRGRVVVATRV